MPGQDIGFGTVLNGCFIAVLKSKGKSRHPTDLMELESFKLRWDACEVQRKKDVAADKSAPCDDDDDDMGEPEDDDVAKMSKGILAANPGKYPKGSVQHMTANASQLLNIYVSLQSEPVSQGALAKLVAESNLSHGSVSGRSGKTVVMILFDANTFAERATRPQYRAAAVSTDLVKKLVGGAVSGRGGKIKDGEVERLAPGDVVCLLDGGRGMAALTAAFKGKGANWELEAKDVVVALDESSLRDYRKKFKGDMRQNQNMLLIAEEPVDKLVPERAFNKFKGTCRGHNIGWVGMPAASDVWMASVDEKKAIYGEHKILGDGDFAGDKGDSRKPGDQEPVFYNFLPESFFAELFKCYSVAAVLDLDTGPAEAAKACLNLHIPYLGICFNENHAMMARARLTDYIKTSMTTAGHPLFDAQWGESSSAKEPAEKKRKPDPAAADPKADDGSDEDSKSE